MRKLFIVFYVFVSNTIITHSLLPIDSCFGVWQIDSLLVFKGDGEKDKMANGDIIKYLNL